MRRDHVVEDDGVGGDVDSLATVGDVLGAKSLFGKSRKAWVRALGLELQDALSFLFESIYKCHEAYHEGHKIPHLRPVLFVVH